MARIARDQTPQRRSQRISSLQSAKKGAVSDLQLESVAERDETPEVTRPTEQKHAVQQVTTPSSTNLEDRFKALSRTTTPKTLPQPSRDQMHPVTVHRDTTRAPDSGLRLGFADITTTGKASIASMQNTPTRPRQSLATTNISPSHQFKFQTAAQISEEGQRMMASLQADAARIKEQLRAQQYKQDMEPQNEDDVFVNGTRKIAKPTGKSSRFSDVHMAQFKKMDSIANHASSFRARPGFTRPTTQSLKRTSSKADLDEPQRPRTAGKSPSSRMALPASHRPTLSSPVKHTAPPSASSNAQVPAKRMRREEDADVSANRPITLAKPVSSRLLSPTKASAARISGATSASKPSVVPRSNSVRSVRSVRSVAPSSGAVTVSPSKIPQSLANKPLPPTPSKSDVQTTNPISPVKQSSSKIPTAFAHLKSILRSPKKPGTSGSPHKSDSGLPVPASSQKKVNFTPSVKSRYAEKLAENSPSPAKVDRENRTSDKWQPAIPYDSSAFVVNDIPTDWESEEEGRGVTYPSLPSLSRPVSRAGPVDHTFSRYAQDHGRRESQQFKSIFTKCNPGLDGAAAEDAASAHLTDVNTKVNRTNPISNASRVASSITVASTSPRKSTTSPSIRRVRGSEPTSNAQLLPFKDLPIAAHSHGLSAKKRRMEPEDRAGSISDEGKENIPSNVQIPGGWRDSTLAESDDEGAKRGGKRARYHEPEPQKADQYLSISPAKKPSAAREAAAKSAKDRKTKASIGSKLTTSRLNALAQPKRR